jgi:hypothetical protein
MKRSDLTIAQVQAKKKKELEQRRKSKKVKKQQKLVDRKIIIDKWIEQHKDTILARIYPDTTNLKEHHRSQYTVKHAEIYWDGYQGLTWNQQKERLAKTLTSMMGEFNEKHFRNALKSFKTSKMWRSPDLIYAENMWNTIKTTFPDIYREIGHELSPANSECDNEGGVTYFYANTWVKIAPMERFNSYSTTGFTIERGGDNNKYEYDTDTRSFKTIVAPQQAE